MIKINKIFNEKLPIIMLIIGTFIFSHFLRNTVLPNFIHDYNIFFMLFLIFCILFIIRININIIILTICLTLSYSLNVINGLASMGDLIYTLFNIILPLLIIGVYISKENRSSIIKTYIKILNILIFILLFMAILDKIMDYSIAIKYWEKVDEGMLSALYNHKYLGQYRFYSFMGHPLYNTQLFLMFLVVNFCYSRKFEDILPRWLVLIITTIGIALTASKTGMILMILAIVILPPDKNRGRYYLVLSFLGIIALLSGMFNTTIERLISTSLTTGRSETWDIYKAIEIYPIKFMTGYGSGVINTINQIITWGTAAFEYPIRGFAIQYGVLFTIIIYIIIGVYPIIYFIRNKNYYILIGYLIIFIDVNTYNTLLHGRDYMIIYGLFTGIMINMCNS